MDQQLKERLVGAVVLVAAAVIVIPIILSGPRNSPAPAAAPTSRAQPATPRFSSRIVPIGAPASTPAPPAVQPAPATPPARAVQQPRLQGEPAVAETPPRPVAASPPAPAPVAPVRVPVAPVAEGGWVVQLGSFSNPRNANALRDRLNESGYRAFAESSGTGADAVTRVFVGPERDRERAEDQLSRLAAQIGLKGIVVRRPGP